MSFDDIKKEATSVEVEVETDEDGAFVAMVAEEDILDEILDEDGCATAVRVDTTGDGYSDTIYVDEDGDGETDIILQDTNCDGNFDTTIIVGQDDDQQ